MHTTRLAGRASWPAAANAEQENDADPEGKKIPKSNVQTPAEPLRRDRLLLRPPLLPSPPPHTRKFGSAPLQQQRHSASEWTLPVEGASSNGGLLILPPRPAPRGAASLRRFSPSSCWRPLRGGLPFLLPLLRLSSGSTRQPSPATACSNPPAPPSGPGGHPYCEHLLFP
jgi:hypothetical protein